MRRRGDDGGREVKLGGGGWRKESVQVGEHRIHTRVKAPSAPVAPDIVTVHGLAASGRYFLPFADAVSEQHRVWVPDLSGFGESSRPGGVLDVLEHAEVMAQWFDAAGVSNAVLVCNSFGCQIGAEVAVLRPDIVSGLVLIGPTIDRRHRSAANQLLRLGIDATREPISLIALTVRDVLAAGPHRPIKTLAHALDHRIEKAVARLDMPVVAVRGARDPISPHTWIEFLRSLSPHVQSETIPDAGHGAHYSNPQHTAAITRRLAAAISS